MDNRTQSEKDFHRAIDRYGSDAYPISRVSRGWIWHEFWGVQGAPVVYKTKREAVQAIERYVDILCDKAAGRL